MTDNEIIKTLAYCCLDIDEKDLLDKDNGCRKDLCYQVALSKSSMDATTCRQRLMEDACNLISRQKAEIDRLNKIIREMSIKNINKICDVGIDAIKEFAERLKEKKYGDFDIPDYVLVADIDNLVKEMTEDKENE